MTDFLWPLFKITLLTTLLWMMFVSILFINESKSDRVYLPPHSTCAPYVQQHETKHAIPKGLLHAISKAESGIKDIKGRLVPWPWTINVQGKGYFYPSKQAAITAVQTLQGRGIKSIDVGCMQVNLYYHPKAFKTLEEAFEPSKNVAYAAHFLTSLKKDHNCWYRAMAHYHSANPVHHIPYQKNVLAIWNRDNKAKGRALHAGIFSVSPSSARSTKRHVRRLGSGRTLKIASSMLMPASNRTSAYRGDHSSHVRRLKLSR